MRIVYSLTPLGWTITERLVALAEWGTAHGDDVDSARSLHCIQ
jgi:DNA-binding HxlR family transcriptional regulator